MSRRVIVFDLDGTLYTNDLLNAAYEHQFERFISISCAVAIDVARRTLIELSETFRNGFGYAPSRVSLLPLFGLALDAWRTFCAEHVNPSAFLMHDRVLHDELRALHGRLLVCSNNSAELVRCTLDALSIADCFDDIVSPADISSLKPSPAMYRSIVRRFGITPDAIMVIGDRPIDVIPARKLGARSILLGENTSAAGHTGIIEAIRSLRSGIAEAASSDY